MLADEGHSLWSFLFCIVNIATVTKINTACTRTGAPFTQWGRVEAPISLCIYKVSVQDEFRQESIQQTMHTSTHLQLSRETVWVQHWRYVSKVDGNAYKHTCRQTSTATNMHTADPPGPMLSLFVQLSRCFPPPPPSLSVYPADEWLVILQLEDRDDTFFTPRVPPLCLSFNYTARNDSRAVIRWWALPRSLALSPLGEREAVCVSVCVFEYCCTSTFVRTKCLHNNSKIRKNI